MIYLFMVGAPLVSARAGILNKKLRGRFIEGQPQGIAPTLQMVNIGYDRKIVQDFLSMVGVPLVGTRVGILNKKLLWLSIIRWR